MPQVGEQLSNPGRVSPQGTRSFFLGALTFGRLPSLPHTETYFLSLWDSTAASITSWAFQPS